MDGILKILQGLLNCYVIWNGLKDRNWQIFNSLQLQIKSNWLKICNKGDWIKQIRGRSSKTNSVISM